MDDTSTEDEINEISVAHRKLLPVPAPTPPLGIHPGDSLREFVAMKQCCSWAQWGVCVVSQKRATSAALRRLEMLGATQCYTTGKSFPVWNVPTGSILPPRALSDFLPETETVLRFHDNWGHHPGCRTTTHPLAPIRAWGVSLPVGSRSPPGTWSNSWSEWKGITPSPGGGRAGQKRGCSYQGEEEERKNQGW